MAPHRSGLVAIVGRVFDRATGRRFPMKIPRVILGSLGAAVCAIASPPSKPAAIGGVLMPEEMKLVQREMMTRSDRDRVDIFVLKAQGAADAPLVITPVFSVEKLRENMNRDLILENSKLQLLIKARIYEDKRNQMVISYSLASGSFYFAAKNLRAAAESPVSPFSSALMPETTLLLIRNTPSILWRSQSEGEFIPLDLTKSKTTHKALQIVVAVRG